MKNSYLNGLLITVTLIVGAFTINYYYTEHKRQICLKQLEKAIEEEYHFGIIEVSWEQENVSWKSAQGTYVGVVKWVGAPVKRIRAKTNGITFSYSKIPKEEKK